MSEEDNGDIGRIIIRVGSTEVDLTGSAREVNDSWLKLKEQDTWASALSKIRSARQDAIDAARQSLSETGVPERGSAFRSPALRWRLEEALLYSGTEGALGNDQWQQA